MRKRKIVGAFGALGVVLALAFGGISLSATGGSSTCDFITGGGFIYPTTQMTGLKGFFAFAAGCFCGSGTGTPPRPYWGHLVYHDKAALVKIHSIKITGYKIDTTIVPHPKARLICGTGKTKSGGNVEFLVRAKDAGEPGINDEFDIQVTGAVTYTTFPTGPHKLGGGVHGGGNVQLHKPHHNSGVFGGTCPPMLPPGGGEEQLAEVSLVKTTDTPTIDSDDDVRYQLVVNNAGPFAAANVNVLDQLPLGNSGLVWTFVTPVPGCTIDSGQLLSCNFASLAPAAIVTIQVRAVPDQLDCSDALVNEATVDATNDTLSVNNTSTAIIAACQG